MHKQEGLTRIARSISAIGWIGPTIGAGVGLGTGIEESSFAVAVALGLVAPLLAIAVTQGIVWILDGFIGNHGADSSIIWPRIIRKYAPPPHEWEIGGRGAKDESPGGR